VQSAEAGCCGVSKGTGFVVARARVRPCDLPFVVQSLTVGNACAPFWRSHLALQGVFG
jgi:hypothetical protein